MNSAPLSESRASMGKGRLAFMLWIAMRAWVWDQILRAALSNHPVAMSVMARVQ